MATEFECGTFKKWLSKRFMMKLSSVISQTEIYLKLHEVISVQSATTEQNLQENVVLYTVKIQED